MNEKWKKAGEVLMGIFTANPGISEEEKTTLAAAMEADVAALKTNSITATAMKFDALTALAGVEVGATELTEDAVGVPEAALVALDAKVLELNATVTGALNDKKVAEDKVETLTASALTLTEKLAAAEAQVVSLTADVENYRNGINGQKNPDVSGDVTNTNPVATAKAKAEADKLELKAKGWGDMVK